MKKKQNRKRMDYWKERVKQAESAWQTQRTKMDERETIYRGRKKIDGLIDGDKTTTTAHVYNIVAENIESIVDPTIYQPKVTPMHEEDEPLARMIEHMIQNELDRLPMEEINDQTERTTPIQGGSLYWPEWDNTIVVNNRKGAIKLGWLHPKQLVPQDGVYTSIDDMDFVAVKLPQTKETIKRKYGIDIDQENESDPDIKGATGDSSDHADDMVTQVLVYYKNGRGGIGRYSWVNEVELEDYEDYQVRHLKRCAVCGAAEDTQSLVMERPTPDGTYPNGAETGKPANKGVCAYCGGTKWEDSEEEYEELFVPIPIAGQMVGGTEYAKDELGNAVAMATARVPFFKPNCYPLILQKNVSVYGQLLGESDVDSIRDQQNTINRLSQKIIDKLLTSGSIVSLPPDTKCVNTSKDGRTYRPENPEAMQYFGVYNLQGDVSQDVAYLAQVYQESRNRMGITDSYQGRADTTATSGKAKQFSAAQSAGRMESKRVMKRFAYAKLFEMIFKLMLAYCDEKRPVIWTDKDGVQKTEEFNRYDFLKQDDKGEWYWNTDFLFSVDDSTGLAQNRSAMWQELTAQLQAGALGNPQELDTLIAYWRAMSELHYPGAGKRMRELVERKEQQMQAAQMAQMQTMQQMPMQQPMI